MKVRVLFFRLLMIVYLFGVAYLCFHNFRNLPDISRTLFGYETDKVVHFLMFLPFPVIAICCFRKLPKNVLWAFLRTLDMCVIGCAIATFTELVQTRLIYRCGDFRDLKADLMALTAGGIIAFILQLILMLKKHA